MPKACAPVRTAAAVVICCQNSSSSKEELESNGLVNPKGSASTGSQPNSGRKRSNFARQCREPTALVSRFSASIGQKFARFPPPDFHRFSFSALPASARVWLDAASGHTPAGLWPRPTIPRTNADKSLRSSHGTYVSRGIRRAGFGVCFIILYNLWGFNWIRSLLQAAHRCSTYFRTPTGLGTHLLLVFNRVRIVEN